MSRTTMTLLVTSVLLLTACAGVGQDAERAESSAPGSSAANATVTPTPTTVAPTPTTVAPTPTARPRDPIAPDTIEAARSVQSLLERHAAAWDVTKSADAVLALWADDVRFTDLLAAWQDEPRATLEQMVRRYVGSPGLGSGPHRLFVDTTGGVESYDVWGLGDATEASPVHEVDVYGTKDGLLNSWHTVYDDASLAHITGLDVDDVAGKHAPVRAYADAWSSADPSAIAELYAETASRTDALWAESADGRQEIAAAATRSFGSHPRAVWQVDTVFGDLIAGGIIGGFFTVRLSEPAACDLGAAVVLETNEAQEIVTERVYWELDSLVRCELD